MNGEKSLTAALSEDGVDWSLLTGLDIQHFTLYCKIRNELSKKYPKPKELMEADDDTVDISKARHDAKAPLFLRALDKVHDAFERVQVLQYLATKYDKKAVRLYCHLSNNWENPEIKYLEYRKAYTDADIYEIVESYFKILRKHGLTTQEEPYYFLTSQRKRKVKIEGEMLKRSTQIDDSEIKISIMEILP